MITTGNGDIRVDATLTGGERGSLSLIGIGATGKSTGGRGGAIALSGGVDWRILPDVAGDFSLGAELMGYAVGKGGAPQRRPRVQIGGTTADPATLQLGPGFFDRGGFADFSLTGARGLLVASDTLIAPVVQSYGLEEFKPAESRIEANAASAVQRSAVRCGVERGWFQGELQPRRSRDR